MSGLYIHVPFCLRKCRYCDFFSVTETDWIPQYLDALSLEMALRPGDGTSLGTIFFGGGTPSLLNPVDVARVLVRADAEYGIARGAEISLEANPGTLTQTTLEGYREAGVTRISLGVQSFDDGILNFLGRIHDGDEARQALGMARAAGFDSLSCDLIYGVPGQTMEAWIQDMETALQHEPDHLSCYMLTLEKGTPLGDLAAAGKVSPMEEGRVGDMFLETSFRLEDQGFEHYEISNFARGAASQCRHNVNYWNQVPYIGLGPAAHSFDGKRRLWNASDLFEYVERLEKGESPVEDREILTEVQHMLEWLYVGLRQAKGINATAFAQRFAQGFEEIFGEVWSMLLDQGMARDLPGRFALTKKGMLYSDGVCQMLAEKVG